MKLRILVSVLFCFAFISIAENVNLPKIAILPVFNSAINESEALELKTSAELLFEQSGRFEVIDVSSHADYSGDPIDQTLRLQAMASDFGVDLFMLLDVSLPDIDVDHGSAGTLAVTRNTSINVTGRFYTSSGTLLGSIREREYSGSLTSSTEVDTKVLALRGVRQVVERSLAEIFPYEFSFVITGGPEFSVPMGYANGVEKGMVFVIIAESEGIPHSAIEYDRMRSHGVLQITNCTETSSSGRAISGTLVSGSQVTAIENSSPGILSLNYALLPTEVVPGVNLIGEEAETSRLVNQAEFTGSTAKWGLSLSGSLLSGVLPRMTSIGIRGEVGTRLPLASPSLGLRLGTGFEAAFLVQNTRSDSVTASANTTTIAATASANLEWLFSSRFGFNLGCVGRFGTDASGWNVTDYLGQNREAESHEVYYYEMKQPPVSFTLGLTYLIY